jgi:DNA modification methylase
VRVDQQIGLEGTLAEYIATLVAVFREVRRVLHPTGCVFLNLGDSYASGSPCDRRNVIGNGSPDEAMERRSRLHGGLKHKDLMMVPARVAIALQEDGWFVRSEIIWHKKAPMPESVTDRPTSAHEKIFLLTKSPRYFWDQEAVREEGVDPDRQRWDRIGGANGHTVRHSEGGMIGASAGRNMRNVWTLGPEPNPLFHFATFPSEIPRRCIKAGTSERGQCSACGAPWVRTTSSEKVIESTSPRYAGVSMRNDANDARTRIVRETTGWQPSCSCDADVVPQTVLDPILGSGTTLLVADQLGREGIGIELSPDYAQMAERRIRGSAPMFTTVEVS